MPTVAPDKAQDAAGNPRFEEQCYLLWNWATFHKLNLKATYTHFTVIVGEPSSIINRLMSRKGIERLFQIKPYEASALVPKIRIFKATEGGGDKELAFSDHTSKMSIDNMMKTGVGRGDGIGIQSFDYDLQGGSTTGGPALVKKGVTKVNMKFLFHNLEMLVHREEGRPALIDLVSLPSVKGEVPTCPEGSGVNISNLWDTKKFQMKVVYGWNVPDGELLGTQLKAAIRGSATTLLVNYEKHDLNFRQDGSVELSVTSNGFADSILSDPLSDILWLDAKRAKNQDLAKAEVEDAETKLDGAKKEQADAEKAVEQEEAAGTNKNLIMNSDKETKLEETEKDVGKKQESLEKNQKVFDKSTAANKIHVYQRLLNAVNSSGKIYFIDLTPEQVKGYEEDVRTTLAARKKSQKGGATPTPDTPAPSEEKLLSPDEKETAEKKTAEGNKTSQPEIKPQVANPEDTEIADTSEAVKKAVEKNLEDPDAKVIDAMEGHNQENLSTTKTASPNRKMFYLYYGDLLDVAFGVLKQNPGAANVRAMMGPISFTDVKTGTKTIVNLADIAISLNKFLEWFNRNVVGAGKTEYLLQDFIRDTIKDLVHAALGENCWDDQGAPTPNPSVSMQPLVVPGTGPSGDEPRIPAGGRLNIGDISSVSIQDIIPAAENKEVGGLHIYVYIYSYGWGASDLNGDPQADLEKGIYHLNIGSDRGLVKEMKFSKIGNPKLDASRATKQGCGLRHLQQQYKVTVEMVGNSIFKPGQYVYINPSTMGSGDPQSRGLISERLGLGGYYVINKVSGDVTSGGFRTTIEAIREAGSRASQPSTTAPTDGAATTEPPVDAVPAG